MALQRTINAWNAITVTVGEGFPLVYTPATTTSHDATLTVTVGATDERGNTLTASVSAAVR